MLHSVIRFAFCTLLLLSSTNLLAQFNNPDPAKAPIYVHLDTMVVKGLTEKDFKSSFPVSEHDELTFEKGDQKIVVQYDASFDFSSIVRQVIICDIQASIDRKFEKDTPSKAELSPLIVKQLTVRVNKLLALKREPLSNSINNLRNEINREKALLAERKSQYAELTAKIGSSPQAAEELKSKLNNELLELSNQIVGNETMTEGLQREINKFSSIKESFLLITMNITEIENDQRIAREYEYSMANIYKTMEEHRLEYEKLKGNENENKIRLNTLVKAQEALSADYERIKVLLEQKTKQLLEHESKIIKLLPDQSKQIQEIEAKIESIEKGLKESASSDESRRLEPVKNDLRILRTKIMRNQADEFIRNSKDSFAILPSLQAKLSETRLTTEVLEAKRKRIERIFTTASQAVEFIQQLDNVVNEMKQHQNTLDRLSRKLVDLRLEINELETQTFQLVPLK